jgi:hypothetical protein
MRRRNKEARIRSRRQIRSQSYKKEILSFKKTFIAFTRVKVEVNFFKAWFGHCLFNNKIVNNDLEAIL